MSGNIVESRGRIGLFGGTFDPPHWGHVRVAIAAADELRLDQLAFLPSLKPPHRRGRSFSPYEVRREMVESCLPLDPRFRICLVEEKENLPGTTFETVLKLREMGYTEDGCHLIWLMGSDSLLEMENWHRPEELLDSIEVAIMPRPGYPAERAKKGFLEKVRVLKTPLMRISASEIRLRPGLLTDLVPSSVAELIRVHGLYGLKRQNSEPRSAI